VVGEGCAHRVREIDVLVVDIETFRDVEANNEE
jgi:hypothetical protein